MQFAALLLCLNLLAPADEGSAVTIYSAAPDGFDPRQFLAAERGGFEPWTVPGFGVVKQSRRLTLKQGDNVLRFTDVAAFIDPTTVSFEDLTDDDTAVLEQNFEFDLVSPEKLLERYIDQTITAVVTMGDRVESISGRLLAASQGQLVIESSEGLRLVPRGDAQVSLGALPGGLITKPTLVWKVKSDSAGDHDVRTTYQTAGLTWRADYNLVLDADEREASIGAWVTLLNVSGASYENARLKLIAGEVQRVQPPQAPMYMRRGGVAGAEMAADQAFQEKAFFEYHLYTLPRPTDIKNNASQQITLFPTASGVPVTKTLVVDATAPVAEWGYGGAPFQDEHMLDATPVKASVYLSFENEDRSGMGMPLPRGLVRVYKEDADDGTLEFVGEDRLDHTPKDERVLVKVGQAFDVTADRAQTNFTVDSARKTMTESVRVRVRNHKSSPQKVLVRETLYRWSTWEVTESSHPYTKVDSRRIQFEVEVPPGKEGVTVTYTARYTW
jgi:hypothetical protein